MSQEQTQTQSPTPGEDIMSSATVHVSIPLVLQQPSGTDLCGMYAAYFAGCSTMEQLTQPDRFRDLFPEAEQDGEWAVSATDQVPIPVSIGKNIPLTDKQIMPLLRRVGFSKPHNIPICDVYPSQITANCEESLIRPMNKLLRKVHSPMPDSWSATVIANCTPGAQAGHWITVKLKRLSFDEASLQLYRLAQTTQDEEAKRRMVIAARSDHPLIFIIYILNSVAHTNQLAHNFVHDLMSTLFKEQPACPSWGDGR